MTQVDLASRSAHHTLRGYLYQVYQSALCWANLADGEYLRFEGDEDIDRYLLDGTEKIQVKDYAERLTYRSEAVRKSILAFLHQFLGTLIARESGTGQQERYVFLTTAEQGDQKLYMAGDVDVLDSWRTGENLDKVIAELRSLAASGVGTKGTFKLNKAQLKRMNAHNGKRWSEFIESVDWRFAAPTAEGLRGRLIGVLGERRPTLAGVSDLLLAQVVHEVFKRSTKQSADDRMVERDDFDKLLADSQSKLGAFAALPESKRFRDLVSLDKLLRRGVLKLPADPSPAMLLQAPYAVVPFYEPGRQEELADLLTWCDATEPVAVRLLTGPGGAGKTRLLIEHGLRMEARGWISGFVRSDELTATIAGVKEATVPILLTVDYAETQVDLVLKLLGACVHIQQQGGPKLRIVFIARAKADWWEALGQGAGQYGVSQLVDKASRLPLQPLAHDETSREAVFVAALNAFVATPQGRPTDDKGMEEALASIHDPVFREALFIHMAALALAHGIWNPEQNLDASMLLTEIAKHELRFVRDPIPQAKMSRATKAIGRVLGAIALIGGGNDDRVRSLADSMLAGGGVDAGDVAQRLRDVYLAQDDKIAPVQPDILGEHFVAEYITNGQFVALVDGCNDEEKENVLTVLTRLARRTGERAKLAELLGARLEALAELACKLTPKVGDPLGIVLAEHVERSDRFESAKRLETIVNHKDYEGAVSLREVCVAANAVLVRWLRAPDGDDSEDARTELARLLSNYSVRLGDVGRREEALATCEEAVEHYRALADARPGAFLPDLATSLNNLSNCLSDLGRREEALAACEEAVKLRRALAEARPDAFLPDLAMSLNTLSNRLSDLGRREDALAACEEAVKLRRALAGARPDAFLPDLASSLNNLSNRLSDLGRREDALAACEEAVKLRRALAGARPDAFLPDLAGSLNNLSNCLSGLGRREEALAACEEAVEIRRALAEARPDAFLPDLASSLNNLSNRLSDLGRREKALEACEEAVEIRRALAGARPDAFLPDLAMSLNNLSNRLSDLGRREAALTACEEAVEMRRALAEARPDAFLPDLAMSLNNLSNHLSNLGRREEALATCEEAVKHYRALAEARPDAFLPDLAGSLNNLSNRLSDLGRREDALRACKEAVEILRALAEARLDAFLPDLAMSLNTLSNRLSDLGRREDALAACEEAVRTLLPSAERLPDAFRSWMQTMVGNWFRALEACGKEPDAELLKRVMAVLPPEEAS